MHLIVFYMARDKNVSFCDQNSVVFVIIFSHDHFMRSSCFFFVLASDMLPSRFARAATVGPCDYEYVSAMPFSYAARLAADRLTETRNRLSSVERYVPPRTYRTAYTSTYGNTTSSSSYDFKVSSSIPDTTHLFFCNNICKKVKY